MASEVVIEGHLMFKNSGFWISFSFKITPYQNFLWIQNYEEANLSKNQVRNLDLRSYGKLLSLFNISFKDSALSCML